MTPDWITKAAQEIFGPFVTEYDAENWPAVVRATKIILAEYRASVGEPGCPKCGKKFISKDGLCYACGHTGLGEGRDLGICNRASFGHGTGHPHIQTQYCYYWRPLPSPPSREGE